MHPAFADAVLVEQVVYELGADSNSGSARLATADVPVLIRRAREERALTDGWGLPPLTALSFWEMLRPVWPSGTPEASGEGSNDVSGADPESRWWRLCPWTTATAVSRLTNERTNEPTNQQTNKQLFALSKTAIFTTTWVLGEIGVLLICRAPKPERTSNAGIVEPGNLLLCCKKGWLLLVSSVIVVHVRDS